MIYRISISTENPLRVATALAEVWGGCHLPLSPLPNSYTVLPSASYGTAIDIYPIDTEFCVAPTDAAVGFFDTMLFSQPITTCGAISVAASRAQIEQIATRERWRTRSHRFGLFEVVELWVENKFMLELLPGSKNSVSFSNKNHSSNYPHRLELCPAAS